MNRKRSGYGLAAVICLGATSFAFGTGSYDATPTEVGRGFVQVLFEDHLPGLSLASPRDERAAEVNLALQGQLVVRGDRLVAGELGAKGECLRILNANHEAVSLNDLVFAFDGQHGTVHARSTESRHLFDLDDMTFELRPDGGAQIVANLTLGTIAGDMEQPERIGAHMAAVVIDVDRATVRRAPAREKLDVGAPSGATTFVGGTPDVIVFDVGYDGGNSNDIHYWGQSGGIAAYSIATQSCNAGTAPLDWFDSGGQLNHPVIGQNMFRYKDGVLEQIGQSWLKHGFCAVNEIEVGCAPCSSTNCDTLGVGCADTYWATLNDGAGGRSKRVVNTATGEHAHGDPAPAGPTAIRGRLQVQVSDIDPAQNPGAEYFIEGQYVTADDAAAGAANNNATWRRVNVVAVSNVDGGGPSHRMEPAIFAWKDQDPNVTIKTVANIGEAGAIKTYFYLAYLVTQTSPGVWHYEYAIQNLTSNQSGSWFEVPVPDTVALSNIGFHDVDYHSGDPYDLTDWPTTRNSGMLKWETTDYATNQNANALRWGTMYNFRFDANSPPKTGDVTLGLFKPGLNDHIVIKNVDVPDVRDAQTTGGQGTFGGPSSGGTVGPDGQIGG